MAESANMEERVYNGSKDIYGGNFFSSLKDIAGKVAKGVKQVLPHVKPFLKALPYGDIAEKFIPCVESLVSGSGRRRRGGVLYGGMSSGGCPDGGRYMTREDLRDRMD